MTIFYRIRVHGKVQGVYFREGTKGVADILRIKGWIRNEPDGTVFMEVIGDPKALEEFFEWCQVGPDRAKVEKFEKEELNHDLQEFSHPVQYPFRNFDILK
jgi:acylphosphatase